MRFRIQENRYKPVWRNRFHVQYYDHGDRWPFGRWMDYEHENHPYEEARFPTLEQARNFIAAEKAKFKARKLEQKLTRPIYHKP